MSKDNKGPNHESAPPQAPMSLEDAVRIMAQSSAVMAQSVAGLAKNQAELSAAVANMAGDREKFLKDEREDIERQERIKRESEKSSDLRTQEIADRMWPTGTGRYRVAVMYDKKIVNDRTGRAQSIVVSDPALPVVEINANSAEEADGRYRKLCGITATERMIRAVPANEKLIGGKADSLDDEEERLPAGVMAAL